MSEGKQKYCLIQTDRFVGASIPLINFADMDRDGMADMVYYDPNRQSIMTFYNRLNANSHTETNLCKSAVNSVSKYLGDANRFFATLSSTTSGEFVDVQKLDQVYNKELVNAAEGLSGRLRTGDIDADGFPDVLLTLTFAANKTTHSVIMINKQAS
jgi:hypothetical protein